MVSLPSAPSNRSLDFKSDQGQVLLKTLAVLALLCLELLLDRNMGRVGTNEIDVLPLARQFADPSWLPTDWYLNQEAGYRFLFQAIFGQMAAAWGFLVTSIVGRLICYSLFAYGLVVLGRRLGLSLVLLLLTLVLYLHNGCDRIADRCTYEQGAIAGEWLIGALEAKAVAYSLLPLAIGSMLGGHYRKMAVLLGLMTSFHVLVGGWVFLVTLGWLWLNRDVYPKPGRYWGAALLLYLVASGFAIPAVFQQLSTVPVDASLAPSYIYVFLRLPHHLNPLSWSPELWIRPIVLLLLLGGSMVLLRRQDRYRSPHVSHLPQTTEALRFAQWVLLSFIPFEVGLLIAPFDLQGRWLQYYPFRLGDVMLPLGTVLLLACVLERVVANRRWVGWVCVLLLSFSLVLQVPVFYQQAAALGQFPNQEQDVEPAWKNFTRWIRQNTAREAIVISPPVDFFNFSWLTERPTLAKLKLLPQNPSGILEWYERLSDLGGGVNLRAGATRTEDNHDAIEETLTKGYAQLTTAQVQALMQTYQASYFATDRQHQLDLPIAYRNPRYILYAKP
jgi:hypothetical protein